MKKMIVNPKYKQYYLVEDKIIYKNILKNDDLCVSKLDDDTIIVLSKKSTLDYGFSLPLYKKRLVFSKAVIISSNEEKLKILCNTIYWLGENHKLRLAEDERYLKTRKNDID